jgi:hypothetical protein
MIIFLHSVALGTVLYNLGSAVTSHIKVWGYVPLISAILLPAM